MSRRDIPQWIVAAVGLWGRQKRRIWIGADWHGNVDGYSQSLLGRIRDEREGAGEQGARSQHWEEVFWGAGFDVQQAMIGMREVPYQVLHLHYVWPPEWQIGIERKASMAGIGKPEYWRELENAETWVHARLDSTSDCKPKGNVLQLVVRSDTRTLHTASIAKVSPQAIDFSALRRSKLSLKR